jgi:hypothetical protein
MAVVDKLKRWGDRSKGFLIGPTTLVGPITDLRRKGFASASRIDGAVDVYEITDGFGATEGAYTITLRPVSERGLPATHGAVGKIALLRQVNGAATPSTPTSVIGIKTPRDSRSSVSLGPAFILNQDRVYVVIERKDTSTLRYVLEVDRIPTLWGLAGSDPSLDLRFAENKSLVDAVSNQNLVTFTRASSGTYFDSAGVLQTASTDVPRFDHNPVTGESLGLLVEEQRSNLCLQSEAFGTSPWSASNVTVSANTDTSPAATLTADTLAATGANGTVRQPVTTTAIAMTFSVYLKRKTGTGNIDISADGTTWVTQTINSSTWTRCVVTQTAVVGTSNPGIRIATSGDEVYAWGGQYE